MNAKELMIEALQRLPAEATLEDGIDQLYTLYKIERGLQSIAKAHAASQAQTERELELV